MHEHTEPLLSGFHPDPSICRSPEGWFLVTSSFEYFPGCPLFFSPDLLTWHQIGHVLSRPTQLPLSEAWISGGIYAPTIRYHEGRYFLITTNASASRDRGSRNFIVHTTDPRGPWTDPVWIDGMDGIDPDLFWDEDGTCYAHWSWRKPGRPVEEISIAQAALDPLTGRLLESPRWIWGGTGGLGPEGPHLYRVGSWYYLMIAEGGTEYGHMETLARSRSVKGPFAGCPRNPVLTHRSSSSAVHAVGHADWVEDGDGRWVGVAHGIRPRGYHKFHVLGRETFLFGISWGADGWPLLGQEGRLPQGDPLLPGVPRLLPGLAFEDDFRKPAWPLEWTWLRNPEPERYLRQPEGGLILCGGKDTLSDWGRPTWVGVRQRAHQCRVRAQVRIHPGEPEGEVGLVVWQNLKAYCALVLRRDRGHHHLLWRRCIGSLCLETSVLDLGPEPGPSVVLGVEASDLDYAFGFEDGAGSWQALGQIEAKFLSTEVSGRFTGVFFALEASGEVRATCDRFSIS